MSDDKILSQSDIDALVESVAGAPGGTREKGMAARTTAPHHPQAPTPSPHDIKALTDKIIELSERLEKLEKAVSKLKQPGNGGAGMTQFVHGFRCTSCNSQGFLAFFVKCTRCGEIKLWGSWPPTK